MENLELIQNISPTKRDLTYFVNIVTLCMCGLTMLGYIIYMTWCIADFVSDIDKRLSIQQLQIEQINQTLQDISQKIDK